MYDEQLKKVVTQYDKSFATKNNEIKTKNIQVSELQQEVRKGKERNKNQNSKLRKQVDELTQQLQKVEAICRYLQV